jgi:hypothetical protein
MKSHSPGANERLVDTESGHPEALSGRHRPISASRISSVKRSFTRVSLNTIVDPGQSSQVRPCVFQGSMKLKLLLNLQCFYYSHVKAMQSRL